MPIVIFNVNRRNFSPSHLKTNNFIMFIFNFSLTFVQYLYSFLYSIELYQLKDQLENVQN